MRTIGLMGLAWIFKVADFFISQEICVVTTCYFEKVIVEEIGKIIAVTTSSLLDISTKYLPYAYFSCAMTLSRANHQRNIDEDFEQSIENQSGD